MEQRNSVHLPALAPCGRCVAGERHRRQLWAEEIACRRQRSTLGVTAFYNALLLTRSFVTAEQLGRQDSGVELGMIASTVQLSGPNEVCVNIVGMSVLTLLG